MVLTAFVKNGWGLFYGTERNNGTEWNDGLNCGTERLLKLKLAGYHCCYTTFTSIAVYSFWGAATIKATKAVQVEQA